MIIAVDFDGTCCVHNYPEIGEENPYAIQTMKSLIENGHKIFLWTMRGHAKDIIDDAGDESIQTVDTQRDTLQEALDWLKERGIYIKGNISPAQFSTSPKQYAAIYIDDAALGCPLTKFKGHTVVDWLKIATMFADANIITKAQYDKIKSAK